MGFHKSVIFDFEKMRKKKNARVKGRTSLDARLVFHVVGNPIKMRVRLIGELKQVLQI